MSGEGDPDIRVVVGDITDFNGDAVVNPANSFMIMGGGVAGAIKRIGGGQIEAEARKCAPLPVGKAVVTGAGKLRCRAVIHSPTVAAPGGRATPKGVYEATRGALEEARRAHLRSIAFPLMGAGVGGLTPETSLSWMVKAIREFGEGLEIYIYVLDPAVASEVRKALKRYQGGKAEAEEG
ncbi:MAG: macro domain-containing protein [Candidatus Nezhaarchaeota archaeon]|nr:macro domain-containing protein [Candidatus Nezhaarchaeota archaeon]